MDKLLKLEKYQLLHNSIYWCGMIGIFILGFFTADTYVTEVMGPTEEIVSSLADIFNGMVYDSTFLLIIMSAILALILGQEFSKRTINLEVSAGHSRKQIFTSKIISYLIAFNLMALVYPVSGCIREFGRFGVADVGMFFYNIIKAIIYSCLLNSAIFLIAILICCYLQDVVKATSVTAIIIFGLDFIRSLFKLTEPHQTLISHWIFFLDIFNPHTPILSYIYICLLCSCDKNRIEDSIPFFIWDT